MHFKNKNDIKQKHRNLASIFVFLSLQPVIVTVNFSSYSEGGITIYFVPYLIFSPS